MFSQFVAMLQNALNIHPLVWFIIAFLVAIGLISVIGIEAVRSFVRRRLPEEAFRSRKRKVPELDQAGRTQAAQLRVLKTLIPESRFIEVDGVKIHYVQAGSGRDLVLLHGIGASTFIWRYLFPIFQGRRKAYRVTAFDLPGFGKSAKGRNRNYGLDAQTELMAKVIAALKLKEPVLVGSSMGGAIALWLGHLHPERFKKIAVLAPATEASLIPPQIRHFRFASRYMRKALNRKSFRFILYNVVSRPELIDDAVVDAYLEPFLDQGDAIAAFWSATSLLSDRRLPGELKGLPSEVLVIFGERDRLVSRRSVDRLLQLLPHAQLLLHPDGGHHIMEDEPEWLVQQLEDWLQ